MKHKKYGFCYALTALFLTVALALSGCADSAPNGSTASQGGTVASSSPESAPPDSGAENLAGLVTAVDGSTLTLFVGAGGVPKERQGEPPAGERPDGEAPPDMPEDGEAPPEGEPPSDRSDMSGDPPELPQSGMKGETRTVVLAEETEVVLEDGDGTTAGTIDDIAVGSMVEVTLEDGSATRVTVRQMAVPDNGTAAPAEDASAA